MAKNTHQYLENPDAFDEPDRAARRDPGRVALMVGIACLITAIIAVIGGARWPGGPSESTIEPFIAHCVLTILGLVACGQLRRHRTLPPPSPEQSPGVFKKIGIVALAFVPMAVIGVNGYLAIEAVRAGGEKLWAIAFAVPAALGFLGFGRNAEQQAQMNPTGPADIVTQSTAGFWNTVGAYLRQTFFIIVFLALMIAAFFWGVVYATIIRMALIEDRFAGWDVFIRVFERLDKWDFLELSAPLIAVVVVYLLFGVVAGLWVHFRRGQREDFDRELSSDEVAAIEEYAVEVEKYAESIDTSGARWVLYIWPLGFLLLIPFTFMFLDSGLGASLLEPMRTPAEGWYIYNDGPGGGEAMAFVTLFAAYCLLLMATPLISPKMAVLSFESNAQQNLRGDSPAQMLRRQIAVDIRRGDLNPEEDFDPATYLKKGFRKLFRLSAKVTLGLAVITTICFAADRADFELITKDGIKYRNYLSTDLIEATYADIAEIDLACRMTGPDDERSISLHYKFIMQNGDEIYILSATNPREVRFRIPRRLDAWKEADALARKVGIPAPAKRYTWRDEVDKLEVRPDECEPELARLLAPGVAAQVMALFATDLANE